MAEDYKVLYEELKPQYDAAVSENTSLKEINEQLTTQIEELTPQKIVAEKQEKPKVSDKTFQHKKSKKHFGFAYPGIKHAGKIIFAEDVIADEALQDELIAQKSGFIFENKTN